MLILLIIAVQTYLAIMAIHDDAVSGSGSLSIYSVIEIILWLIVCDIGIDKFSKFIRRKRNIKCHACGLYQCVCEDVP